MQTRTTGLAQLAPAPEIFYAKAAVEHFYLERDGQVYLIREGGRLRFPLTPQEITCPYEIVHTMRFHGERVHYCKPLIEHHPEDWWHKDHISELDEALPIVRLAVSTSLPRLTAKAIIIKDRKLLMVRPKRGYNAGHWALPGGFVGYGESPEEATLRETREETGVPCRIVRFLGTESRLGRTTNYHWHTFFYEAELEHERFQPAPDEIETVEWINLDQALQEIRFYERLCRKLRQEHKML
ncbi:NUDIX hydrolase [Candidatus Acetothermia bacterium]|nr:NUDIX hydrolase [Candidatus Acetothermia bacterium]MCI2431008.1 NUDIX hydrolase [Candidatus Acetothermia bacterium]MCI2436904.1 NUDIX hydrolase [Candidatus Acetothermia bacterium]